MDFIRSVVERQRRSVHSSARLLERVEVDALRARVLALLPFPEQVIERFRAIFTVRWDRRRG